jgi:nucleotidyltransferase substrate binding protein (TIGR01987 family)
MKNCGRTSCLFSFSACATNKADQPGLQQVWRHDMAEKDIRWIQRFNNFTKALGQLSKFIQKGDLNELEKQGLIQAFEYTYELAWNTIKDYFEDQGETGIHGSRNAFRLAFRRGLIENGQAWMDMIKSRTLTTHTYNEEIAEAIANAVMTIYYTEFILLENTLQKIKNREE